MRSISLAGRIAAVGAVVAAIVIVAVLLFSSGSSYTVKADFENAAQLVSGNQVQVGGVPVGSVDNIALTQNGQAEITMTVNKPFVPLRQGTRAVIRQASLSGIANRYVDLEMPPGDQHSTGTIANGGRIPAASTTTAVDLDQVFNTFDPTTRKALQSFFVNSAAQYTGKEQEQRLAFHYLNPALATSSRVFGELNRDQPLLVHFLTDSAALVSDLAVKRNDLAALIGNLNTTFRALGSQKVALADAISRLPGFMRQSNTTFVDLRSALNDVDPLVNASKPVAPKLNKLLLQLRPFAHDARPTIADLARIVGQAGPNNDLFDLEQTLPPLASIALDTKRRSVNEGGGNVSVGNVRGAFPETAQALRASAPIIAFGRPYTVDLMGWFDDFSTSGGYDALGNYSRGYVVFDAFDLAQATPAAIPLTERLATTAQLARTQQYRRCPGGAEEAFIDKSNVPSAAEQQLLDCRDSARGAGNLK